VGILPPPEDVKVPVGAGESATLDTEGRQSEQGTSEVSTDNVVPMPPRDWLGSRDELVPLGRSRSEPDRNDDDTTTVLRPLSDASVMAPPSAADFWGERADTIHDAIQTPVPAEPGPPATTAKAPQPRRDWSMRRLTERASVKATLAVLGGLAIAAVGIGYLAGHGTSSAPRAETAAGIGLLRGPNARISTSVADAVGGLKRVHWRAHRGPSKRLARGTVKARVRHQAPASHTSSPVRYSATPTTTTRAAAPTPPSYSSSGSTATSAAQGAAQSSTATSTHAKAYGSSGALGPGSSPNG
jgi:hypothetical protein